MKGAWKHIRINGFGNGVLYKKHFPIHLGIIDLRSKQIPNHDHFFGNLSLVDRGKFLVLETSAKPKDETQLDYYLFSVE